MRIAIAVAACALVALSLAGCGDGDDDEGAATTDVTITETIPTETETVETETTTTGTAGDPVAGKEVFATAGCGGCHTLSDAGSTGSVGPSLDGANLELAAVVEQVENGGGAMPPFAGQLTAQQIQDVAAYVVQASQS